MFCDLCSEKTVGEEHYSSDKHIKNKVLHEYSANKKEFAENRNGIFVSCNAQTAFGAVSNCVDPKVIVSAKPSEQITMRFKIYNDSPKDKIHVKLVQMIHSKFSFVLNNHGLDIGCTPQCVLPKSNMNEEITVKFRHANIGQYETTIIFLFTKSTNENIIIMRDMVVYVEESPTVHEKEISPYDLKTVMATNLYKTKLSNSSYWNEFRITKSYKKVFASALKLKPDASEEDHLAAAELKEIFDAGVNKDNYVRFFHCLLWYEETIARINLKKYNMSGILLANHGNTYSFFVPGLAEKRPSLLLGDLLFIKPHHPDDVMFEAVISEINENVAHIKGLDLKFSEYYKPLVKFDVRFFMSRAPLVRMHRAVHSVWEVGHQSKIFPTKNTIVIDPKPIVDLYNPLVGANPEQLRAVRYVVAGGAGGEGAAPFLLHGPPGTGKTVTLVEAALQLIGKNPDHRIMICTDSNMAADNVATMLIKYAHMFPSENFMLRANSKYRNWESLPECLRKYSNGHSRDTFTNVSIVSFMAYKIVITTLSHAAKFGSDLKSKGYSRHVQHVFIDEAAQATEPGSLVPLGGLLAPRGRLLLAGDPLQLGPVVISHDARNTGLGLSLMERLKNTCPLYSDEQNDPQYVVMLRNNFRSDQDILDLPNQLFYKGQLRASAPVDPISATDILGERRHSRALVFHGVLSREQKVGKSPSFFNTIEIEIVQLYVTALIKKHNVQQCDIGIVTPYIRQVYHIKTWLKESGYDQIEVGTVEAYQGKEKRVIIISTVRANCDLLGHDAKFQLGFLVDDKRFNVALTRAKAKAIIIGNPLCLQTDAKWRMLMQKCRDMGTYFGVEWENASEVSREFIDNLVPLLQQLEIKA